jgi:hypothetical protein
LLERSIDTQGNLGVPYGEERWIDLREIDFEALVEKFKTGRKRTLNSYPIPFELSSYKDDG